jgi:hypothetical protein
VNDGPGSTMAGSSQLDDPVQGGVHKVTMPTPTGRCGERPAGIEAM